MDAFMYWQVWVAIVVSAAVVWLASFLLWAVLPLHRKDYRKLPDEEGFSRAVRELGVAPGSYLFPYADTPAQERDPEYLKRMQEGPTGTLVLWGQVSMAKNMVRTFVVYLVVGVFIAYLGGSALEPGAEFARVFQVLGTAGILAHSFAFLPHDIWFQASPRSRVLKVMDGVALGLLTGLVFALLWPGG